MLLARTKVQEASSSSLNFAIQTAYYHLYRRTMLWLCSPAPRHFSIQKTERRWSQIPPINCSRSAFFRASKLCSVRPRPAWFDSDYCKTPFLVLVPQKNRLPNRPAPAASPHPITCPRKMRMTTACYASPAPGKVFSNVDAAVRSRLS